MQRVLHHTIIFTCLGQISWIILIGFLKSYVTQLPNPYKFVPADTTRFVTPDPETKHEAWCFIFGLIWRFWVSFFVEAFNHHIHSLQLHADHGFATDPDFPCRYSGHWTNDYG